MIGINKKMCVYIIYITLVALVWLRSGGGGDNISRIKETGPSLIN